MTPSPELSPRPALTLEEQALYNIDRIEDWRDLQRAELYRIRQESIVGGDAWDDASYVTEFNTGIDASLENFLHTKGIEKTSPHYDEIFAFYRDISIDNVPEVDWLASPKNTGSGTDPISRRDRIINDVRAKLGIDIPKDTVDTPTDPDESEALRSNIEDLAKKKREAYIAMITAPLFRRGKRQEAQAAYDAAEAEYNKALAEQYRHEIESIDDTLDPADRKKRIEEIVNARSNADNLSQHEMLIKSGGKKAELLSKYAGYSTAKKIGVGMLLGAGGAAAGFLAGAVGAGTAAVVGGLKVYGIARSYQLGKAKIYEKPADDAMVFRYDADGGDASVQAVEYTTSYQREKIRSAEKTKKRALAIGFGAAALTGAAGAAGSWAHSAWGPARHVGANDGHWKAGYAQHISKPSFGVDHSVNSNGAGPSLYETVHTNEGRLPSSGSRGYEFGTGSGSASTSTAEDGVKLTGGNINGPNVDTVSYNPLDTDHGGLLDGAGSPAEQAPTGHDYLAYAAEHHGANYVSRGEGMYHTFSELGIKSDDHNELLKLVGPKLEKSGFLYRDEKLGGWGISEAGKTPDSVLKTILQTAQEHHMVDVNDHLHGVEGGDFAKVVDIDRGEGILQSLKDAGMENPTLDDVHNIQNELIKEGVAYKADNLGGAGLYYDGGTMDHDGAQTIWDYVHGGHDHDVSGYHGGATEHYYVGNGQTAPIEQPIDPNSIQTDPNARVYVGEGKTQLINPNTTNQQLYEGNGRSALVDTDTQQVGSGDQLVDPDTLKGIDNAIELDEKHVSIVDWPKFDTNIHEISNYIKSHNFEAINENMDYQSALKYLHEDIGTMKYPGTNSEILFLNREGHWQFNEIPASSYVPMRVTNTLIAYEQRLFALAA